VFNIARFCPSGAPDVIFGGVRVIFGGFSAAFCRGDKRKTALRPSFLSESFFHLFEVGAYRADQHNEPADQNLYRAGQDLHKKNSFQKTVSALII
jgi:hypothetical protein